MADSIANRFNRLQMPSRLAPTAGITATNQYGQRSFGGSRRNPPMMIRPAAPTLSPMMQNIIRQAQMKKAQAASGTPMPGVLPISKPTPPPSQPSGFMGAFSQPLTSPVGQAISQAAIAGARASDYSPTPVSLGRVLAEMGAAASQGYAGGLKEQRAAEAADFARRMQLMKFGQEERKISGTAGKEAQAKQEKITDREIGFAKDFRSESKPFKEAMLNFNKISANALSKRPSGATDIAMIFNFMKALDPESVVRGQEYEAAAGAGSLLKSLGQAYNRLLKGEVEKLPDVVRQDFYQTALETFRPYVELQMENEATISQQASALGLDPKNIIPKSLAPKIGSKNFPHVVYSEDEILALPAGEYFVRDGQLGVTE